mmetsp:Transcript_15766/g.49371  ORF Transcript_15766/g.49371 Transcript_15766/m.49371 type:complete len:393 (-) Transcript_15766:189-1367(-)
MLLMRSRILSSFFASPCCDCSTPIKAFSLFSKRRCCAAFSRSRAVARAKLSLRISLAVVDAARFRARLRRRTSSTSSTRRSLRRSGFTAESSKSGSRLRMGVGALTCSANGRRQRASRRTPSSASVVASTSACTSSSTAPSAHAEPNAANAVAVDSNASHAPAMPAVVEMNCRICRNVNTTSDEVHPSRSTSTDCVVGGDAMRSVCRATARSTVANHEVTCGTSLPVSADQAVSRAATLPPTRQSPRHSSDRSSSSNTLHSSSSSGVTTGWFFRLSDSSNRRRYSDASTRSCGVGVPSSTPDARRSSRSPTRDRAKVAAALVSSSANACTCTHSGPSVVGCAAIHRNRYCSRRPDVPGADRLPRSPPVTRMRATTVATYGPSLPSRASAKSA